MAKETMTAERAKQIAFTALQLLRSELEKQMSDYHDVDDYLFSNLDIEVGELVELYAPYGELVYSGSCFEDGSSTKDFDIRYYSSKPNTRIWYLYRDASNYKVQNCVVVPGRLTPQMVNEIVSCLESGEYFIPSQVGLPEARFGEEWTEDDHVWFELDKGGFEATDIAPTESISAAELYSRFKAAQFVGWDDTPPACAEPEEGDEEDECE